MIPPAYAASEPLVKAKTRHVCLEHPQMQPQARISLRKSTNERTKKSFTYALTTSLRENMKIIHKASPDGIEVTIATDKGLCSPG